MSRISTRRDSFFIVPWILPFSVHTQIQSFSGTRRDSLSILPRILPFPDTRPDSTFFLYSHRFDPCPVLAEIVFRYYHELYLFPVLDRILPFFVTHTDSTLFRYSPRQVGNTCTNSTFFVYSPEFYHFSVLTLIRPFSGTRQDNFSILAWILPFPVLSRILLFFGTHIGSTISL